MRILLFAIRFCLSLTSLQAADWSDVAIPNAWRKVPSGELAPVEGYSWYRTFVQIPDDWADTDLTLFIEALDDARSVWVNGVSVGTHGNFPPAFRSGLGEPGRFTVAAALINSGKINCIAIRVLQIDPRTNFNVAPPVLLNPKVKQAIRMNGKWQYRPGDNHSWAAPTIAESDKDLFNVFSHTDAVDNVEFYVTQRQDDREPLSPQKAEAAFVVPDDLEYQLVLSEPEITQPLFMTWDERGRMWVIQYRQYPEPAGLKMLSRDVYLRSVYDKVPLPPPHGTPGRDRISIHEDTDGDGVYDKHKTFIDGLNIASSVAVGRNGAYVANPPYLLFYPDADEDDVPDGDPEVLLEGFGLEDSHSVINSIRFGPDGWLYGCQGSTVTAMVKRPGTDGPVIQTMGQQVWRYHPEQRIFEVFAEGGGNAFGLALDAKGRIYSGHNGGDTRGFHYVQGAYYRKGFAKHGSLSNPWTFGFFEAMKHDKVPRFTHNFIIYEESHLPEQYHGQLFGIEPLQGQIVLSDIRPHQSSFETEDIMRVVKTDDPWFRPVDIKSGPDGAIYVADMYEQRIDHSSHYAGRIDRTNGRIYRLTKRDPQKTQPTGLTSNSSGADLLKALTSRDKWRRQTAVRLLGDGEHSDQIEVLLQQIFTAESDSALSSLWGLHAIGGFTDAHAVQLLLHDDEFVREWTIRLLADNHVVSTVLLPHLAELATSDPSIHVRKQLAASAQRLPAAQAMLIVRALLEHDADATDIHQPLMIWWAVETAMQSEKGRHTVIDALLESAELWHRPLVRDHLLSRLMKRCILPATRSEFLSAARLLNQSPDSGSTQLLMEALDEALEGRSLTGIPAQLLDAIDKAGGGSDRLKLRQQQPAAIESALILIADPEAEINTRIQFIEILGEIRLERSIPVMLPLLNRSKHAGLLEAVLNALHSFSGRMIGQTIIDRLADLPEHLQPAAANLLATRSEWSVLALEAVQTKPFLSELLTEDVLQQMELHPEPRIGKMIRSVWGELQGTTTEEMNEETKRFSQILATGSGNPRAGKPLYMKNCGRCHRLFQEGGKIGPDLTAFQRDDLTRLLQNIVDPDLEIRKGFENYMIVAEDGRLATGFLVSQDEQLVVLRTTEGVTITFFSNEIDDMLAVPESVMPKGSLKDLSDQQIRDLFAYLRSSQPVNY